MAIGIQTFTKNSGFSASDVIDQLEDALEFAQYHGEALTGIVTGIVAYNINGGTGDSLDYTEVRPSVSSRAVGIASTCSFYVSSSGGVVNNIRVNRPGSGYQTGDTFTLAAADIGKDQNVTLSVEVDNTVYGSTSTFYCKDTGGTNPFGILRMPIEADKLYGETYYGFQVADSNTMKFHGGSGFMPYVTTESTFEDRKSGDSTRFAGASGLDLDGFNSAVSNFGFSNTTTLNANFYDASGFDYCSDNSTSLALTVYKSTLDPNFSVFLYKQPDKAASYYTTRNFACFFLHKFTSSVYDLDNVFSGGITFIDSESSANPSISLETIVAPFDTSGSNQAICKRSALAGYSGHSSTTDADTEFQDEYFSMTFASEKSPFASNCITSYYRNNTQGSSSQGSSSSSALTLPDAANFNAVIKGIPLLARVMPTPYYLPDDFVFISFDIPLTSQLIDSGDTITISPTEIYTIISVSHGDQESNTRTRGIAFCGRFV